MNYLSLFSGACGGDLGCQHLLGWDCVGYVERPIVLRSGVVMEEDLSGAVLYNEFVNLRDGG